MTWFQSIATSPGGMPSIAMLPPWCITRSMSRNAEALPDISSPTSKPSSMPSDFIASSMLSFFTFSARVAPMRRARSRR
ncbi:hypothetical protein D3C83_57110 [compost metagenome]